MSSRNQHEAQRFQKAICFASQKFVYKWFVILAVAGIQPAQAQDLPAIAVNREVARESQQTGSASVILEEPISELERPASTVAEWIAQLTVQITGVQVNPTDTGFELLLETAEGSLIVPDIRTVGNALIADIPNAVLALPGGDEFQAANPIDRIALVEVTPLGNGVRVAITGTDAPPIVAVRTDAQTLVLGVEPGTAAAATDPDAIEVIVTGEQEEEDYNPSNATTATRTDTPLRDIPQSIQVIPQQVLEDQQTTQLQDALRNVSGVVQDGNFGGTGGSAFIIRGFSQNGNFRNGFIENNFYTPFSDFANIDRIEVLRGPASVLFGQIQPGGIINAITEQPLREPFYELGFSAGSFDFYRPTLDISGSITGDGDLRYRLNVAYQNSGSFRNFVNSERLFIAPVLAWDISDRTRLTLDFEYLDYSTVFDRGVVALSDGSLPLPIDRFLGYPDPNDFDLQRYRYGYILEHQFSEDLRIRNALSITSNRIQSLASDFDQGLVDDRLMVRQLREVDWVFENYGLQTEVVSNFETGSILHELLVGVELSRATELLDTNRAELPPLDIFDPDYDIETPTEFIDRFDQSIRTDSLGIYIQDQVALLDNLRLLIGGRFDFIDQESSFLTSGTRAEQSDSAFSPRVGIVYQPSDQISLYASYSRSFFPVVGQSANSEQFEPERGTQYEVGVRGDFYDGRLSAILSAFEITKSNILTTDLDDPSFSIQVGEQRSRGIEFNLAGEILPGWNVIAGYAYTDARVTEDNDIPADDRLTNVPENTANLWTTYQIQDGDLEGLGVGLGLFFVGEREGELPNSNFQLPGYVRTDAAIFYERDNWEAAINIRNLFDVEYYETAQFREVVYPGAPFTLVGSIRVRF